MIASVTIDHTSLLARVEGGAMLDAVETELAAHGLTLGLAAGADGGALDVTVAEWIARGTPGAASIFSDPADHVIAGLEATLNSGDRLEVRPVPRRAVGPDLLALVLGCGGRLGRVDRAWIRVHRKDAARPRLPLPGVDLDPPVSGAEARLFDAIARELGIT